MSTLSAPTTVEAPFSTALLALAERRDDVVVLSADLSKYTDIAEFAERYPDRFFQMGMAEQNMMGVAGGLAKSGYLPIAVTYGVFATRRAGEQIQMALATGPRRSAIVVAFLPGISTPFRATHQATDDLSIMRAVPGMTVIDPADATDVEGSLPAAIAVGGPVYMRGLRGRVEQVLDPDTYSFRVGFSHEIRRGSELGLIATGLGTQWALEAASLLEQTGRSTAVLHVPTLKPFDVAGVKTFASRFHRVVTIENHSTTGGLGSAVCEALSTADTFTHVLRLGVPDAWGHAGPIDYVRQQLGLDAAAIAATATGL